MNMKKIIFTIALTCFITSNAQNVTTNGTILLDDATSRTRIVVDAFLNSSNRVHELIEEIAPSGGGSSGDWQFVTNAYDTATNAYAIATNALAPATNYTDAAVGELKRQLEVGEVYVSNADFAENSEVSRIADIAYRLQNYRFDERTADEIFEQLDTASHITTNDVCNIVTSVSYGAWEAYVNGYPYKIFDSAECSWTQDGWVIILTNTPYHYTITNAKGSYNDLQVEWSPDEWSYGDPLVDPKVLTIRRAGTNILGLARLSDIPPAISNTVTKAYIEDLGIESGIQEETDPVWTAAKGGYATTGTVAQVSEAVGTLWSYVYGDSVWIAVTNYMWTVGGVSPSFQLWEVRNGATNLVYWSKEEITNVTHDLIYDCKTNLEQTVRNAVADMPDKAWSKYQSATGNEAPDGVTIVSTPTIQLTGGGEWYRYVDVSSNSVWFLKSNGLHTFGGDMNGYFRILDDEGNATFEVRKTDSYLVDAVASSVHFDENGNFCVSFESNIEPVIYTTASLENPNFLPQGDDPNVTVTWTQSGGVYTATLEQAEKGPSLFAYAKVEVHGETVIRNIAPTDVSGGILCTDGVHKVRPVYNNGTITWEVVQ